MDGDVKNLLVDEIDYMIARAQRRAHQYGVHLDGLEGEARRDSQLALSNVQRSLERLRSYRQALINERVPGLGAP